MRILVLGGTKFLGRTLVGQALARGHDLTLFHRGRTGPELFPEARHVPGDRDGGLGALGDERWDAVIDTCGYLPRLVGDSARALRERVERYLFVSSVSAYAEPLLTGPDEDAPLATLESPGVEEVRGDTYGGLKAACEAAVLAALPDRALIVRPGLIVGPHDPTGRFTYWPRRLARGGDVLAPGRPDAPVQVIDVRDLAPWMLALLESARSGVYNAVGPAGRLTMSAMLEACREAAGVPAELVWVEESFLLERKVAPWTDLPVWLPWSERALSEASNARAIAAGLAFRPLVETARETLLWDRETPPAARPPGPAQAGPGPLSAGREAALLAEWRAR